jgi:ADP-ribose pyrophosphatase YjhB (NUDIX family)
MSMGTQIWTPRVTVAAVIERQGRFLLVEERSETGDKALNQPAGHLEQGESLVEAVIRETREETAWRFHPTGLVGIYRWRVPDTDRVYLRFCFHGAVSDPRPDQPLDEGILATHWLRRDELNASSSLRSPLVLVCLDDFIAGRRLPLQAIRDI